MIRLTTAQRVALLQALRQSGWPTLTVQALKQRRDGTAWPTGDSYHERETLVDLFDKIDPTRHYWASIRRALRLVYKKLHTTTRPPDWLAPPEDRHATTTPDPAPPRPAAGAGPDGDPGPPDVGREHGE